MGSLSKNIGMDEVKNQKTQSEYFAGKSDFQDFIITNAQRKIKLLKLKLLFFSNSVFEMGLFVFNF